MRPDPDFEWEMYGLLGDEGVDMLGRGTLPPDHWPPSEDELERSFTQWEREQRAPHPEREPLEVTKQVNPSAVVEAAWRECE